MEFQSSELNFVLDVIYDAICIRKIKNHNYIDIRFNNIINKYYLNKLYITNRYWNIFKLKDVLEKQGYKVKSDKISWNS